MGVNGCVYGCQNWHSVGRPDFRNARFVQVGTYIGSAFVSGADDGRGFGSVFRHHHPKIPTTIWLVSVRPTHLDDGRGGEAQMPARVQRCGSNSSMRLLG